MDAIAEVDAHRDGCVECSLKPWTICAVAARLLEAANDAIAERPAPTPAEPAEA